MVATSSFLSGCSSHTASNTSHSYHQQQWQQQQQQQQQQASNNSKRSDRVDAAARWQPMRNSLSPTVCFHLP